MSIHFEDLEGDVWKLAKLSETDVGWHFQEATPDDVASAIFQFRDEQEKAFRKNFDGSFDALVDAVRAVLDDWDVGRLLVATGDGAGETYDRMTAMLLALGGRLPPKLDAVAEREESLETYAEDLAVEESAERALERDRDDAYDGRDG